MAFRHLTLGAAIYGSLLAGAPASAQGRAASMASLANGVHSEINGVIRDRLTAQCRARRGVPDLVPDFGIAAGTDGSRTYEVISAAGYSCHTSARDDATDFPNPYCNADDSRCDYVLIIHQGATERIAWSGRVGSLMPVDERGRNFILTPSNACHVDACEQRLRWIGTTLVPARR